VALINERLSDGWHTHEDAQEAPGLGDQFVMFVRSYLGS
jgi:hypothetical protein